MVEVLERRLRAKRGRARRRMGAASPPGDSRPRGQAEPSPSSGGWFEARCPLACYLPQGAPDARCRSDSAATRGRLERSCVHMPVPPPDRSMTRRDPVKKFCAVKSLPVSARAVAPTPCCHHTYRSFLRSSRPVVLRNLVVPMPECPSFEEGRFAAHEVSPRSPGRKQPGSYDPHFRKPKRRSGQKAAQTISNATAQVDR